MSTLDNSNESSTLVALAQFGITVPDGSPDGETAVSPRVNAPAPPSWVERNLVVITVFTLIHGLPIDWFRTRADFLNADGNSKMVAVQLALMLLGIARVAGWFNWMIRVIQVDVIVISLAGLAMGSTIWSDAPFETFKQATVLVAVTLYAAYLVLRFHLPAILELMARVFLLSGLLNLAFVVAFPVYGIEESGAWDGIFFQKNGLGFAAVLAIPILIVVGRSGPSWRHIYYLGVPVYIALLIGSQSRTMLVATIGSVLVLFISRMFRGRRTLRGAIILSLIIMSVTMVAVATANIGLLTEWLDKDITLTGRIPLWEGLIPIALEEPILGYGYKAAFQGYFSPVHEVWVSEGWEPSQAHNALLHAWLELGIIGVTLYVVAISRVVVRAVNTASSSSGAVALWPLALVSSVLLLSITESGIVNSFEAWMLFAIAAFSSAIHSR